jgi:hypothetical protein
MASQVGREVLGQIPTTQDETAPSGMTSRRQTTTSLSSVIFSPWQPHLPDSEPRLPTRVLVSRTRVTDSCSLLMLRSAAEGVGPGRNGCIMTKNRARKLAARQRAALTGERYVVAQRAVAEHKPGGTGRMHDAMHKIPGMPSHVDGGLQATASRGRNSHSRLRRNPRHNEPRVLVAWQNWIGRRLGVGSH